MKKINNIIVVLVALLALVGCKEKMRELNTNPDLISDTQVKYMFTGALSGWENIAAETQVGQMHILMQYISHYLKQEDGNVGSYRKDADNAIAVQWTQSHYNLLFGGTGNKLQNILDYIDQQVDEDIQYQYADIRAIVEGLMQYMQYRVLENYGASVYSEAFKAISEGISKPKYEYMNDLWSTIDQKLAEVITILNKPMDSKAQTLGSQDYFTGYKTTKAEGRGATITKIDNWSAQRTQWKKFFNMTRLENAWLAEGRISNFDQIFNEVAAVSDGYFTDYDDSFFFNTAASVGNSDANIYISAQYCMSQNFINFLIKNDDPRLPFFARPSGATEKTSAAYVMLKKEFPDTLDKYFFLDGKHPYLGLCANPNAKQKDINDNPATGFVNKGILYINNLPNKNYPAGSFDVDCDDFGTIQFATNEQETFNTSILVGSEVQYRYFLVCGGKNHALHNYSGNGIKIGNGDITYKNSLQADGSGTNDGGNSGQGLHLRRALFSYPRQCFLLSMIGKTFAGKDKEAWYEEGMRSSFTMLRDEAHLMAIQAYTGGDQFDVDRSYPSELTQTMASGDVTFTYPYTYSDAQIDDYVAKHPYSKENLMDQFYVYGYNDPAVVWKYWRKTGLPEFKEHATRQEADAEEHIYLEQPYNGTEKMRVIRRNQLTDRNTLNPNYAEAKEYLQNDPNNPEFGGWEETDGKIWWESASTYPTGWAGIK